MTPLTEHQFHTVWTAAVGMPGYNKKLFQDILQKLYKEGAIIPSKKVYSDESIRAKMEQAHAWLLLLDVPSELVNKMCVLSFLALCGIKPDTSWKEAKSVNMSMTKDIMTFVADNYNLTYKSGTRESFRREGINILLNHGIIDLNPGNPHLGPNSPLTHYAIKREALKKMVK